MTRAGSLTRLRSGFGVVVCTTFGFWALGGAVVGVSFASAQHS